MIDYLFISLIIVILFILYYECLYHNQYPEYFTINRKLLELKLANTPKEREIGLMYRKKPLKSNHIIQGMIFDYKGMGKRSLWMKNTYIPLDMIFLNSNYMIIGIIQNAQPHDISSHTINRNAHYVIEINGGTIQKLKKENIKIKDVFNKKNIVLVDSLD